MRKDFFDGNYAEKKVTLTIRVPSDFDREDERMLDDAISDLLYKNGYELVDSKEYRDISPERENIVNATFVSVWDGGFEVATPCKVNMTSGHVFDIEVFEEINADNVEVLDDEYIRLPDGTEHHVRDPYKEDSGFFWYGSELELALDPLEFIFDEEITVSEDGTTLDGYVWATDALVARLQAQELPLTEDQFMENINFYPVYDVANHSVTLEGHYYLEDGHHATGTGFTLPLTAEESEALINAFEAYCLKSEGKTCAAFLESVLSEDKTSLFEQLKSALFMAGTDAIEDFLGYEIDPDEDKDVTDRRLDMVYEQMPEDVLNQYYAKYNIGVRVSLSDQIQSASSRAVEPQTSSQAVKQEFEPEI